MPDFDMTGMPGEAGKVFRPFAEELLRRFSASCLSISVTGSCITGDFVSGISDINSVLVLNKIDMEDLDTLVSLSRFKKKRIRSPLIMTEEYIRRSLDVFPIEFLDIKLFHKTVFGTDFFERISLDKAQLRIQCERDLKGKLVNLQRGYVSCEGRTREIRSLLLQALPGYFALLRSMMYLVLAPKEPPARKEDVLHQSEDLFHINLSGLRGIMHLRGSQGFFPNRNEVLKHFNEVCKITHELCVATDALVV